MGDWNGYSTRHLSSRDLDIEFLETAGPRIVRLSYKGSANLLAEIPKDTVTTPYGDFHYQGGHRLWHAPEAMPRTYIPDNDGLTITDLPDGVLLDGKIEQATGIHKRIAIHIDPEFSHVVLNHTLVNEGTWEVELAPWALTMLRLGGTAILPTQVREPDKEALLPDRHFSLWPYSHINDPRLRLEDKYILLVAKPALPPFKIGMFNPVGWIAYWVDGILFRKTFDIHPGLNHPDFNCNAESYCNSRFIELESLGPLVRLPPGGAVSHTETWDLFDGLEQDFIPQELIDLLG